jgi:bifunctional non-homologous end joining protein LigD
MAESHRTVRIGGRSLRVSSLDKVLYPADGTTKGDVLGYYAAIASVMVPHCRDRAATRKRWPDGVGELGDGEAFFQKDVGDGVPEWVETAQIQHRERANTYPLVNDDATLVWLAQLASLEIHVPQWRFGAEGEALNPDRLVLDLDPGRGVDLRRCAEVAFLVRDILREMGLEPVPVTSGSKGIHVYAALDGRQTSAQVTAVARELARSLEADHPGEITSVMKRSIREGKVFVDWSQNSAKKTTVAPYSLRGRALPMVAAPRTWRELSSPSLKHLHFTEVLQRVARRGDPMESFAAGSGADRLATYRSMRDSAATPEPVPEPGGDEAHGGAAPVFVIQRHEARRLHHDFRLEHDGVLVSWALPKGVPTDPSRNHLAVPTEDHPMAYRHFEGTIPKGQYGAGEVRIFDTGTCEFEKWRDDEVIVTLHGERDGGLGGTRTFALFRTSVDPPQWMIHLMDGVRAQAKPAPAPVTAAPKPMLATLATEQQLLRLNAADWAFEMKWDGMRAIVVADADASHTRLVSRSGADVTAWFPELGAVHELLDADSAVLDGEVVAMGASGAPSFERLQQRMNLKRAQDVRAAMREVSVSLVLFDVLSINGQDCQELPYSARRELLAELLPDARAGLVVIPPALEGTAEGAFRTSKEHHLEGVVAKRRDSRYRPGVRSEDWLKHPFVDTAEVVVIGWRDSDADPKGFKSLLVATADGSDLSYAGRVSSGFTAGERKRIRAELERSERKTPPVAVASGDQRDAHWVTPRRTGEVSYRERTSEGRFRHPVWRGFRPDKPL